MNTSKPADESLQKNEEYYMKAAIRQACKARASDEVPVGCVIVKDGKIIGRGYNRRETRQLPFEHAEIMAIAQAARKLKSWRLEDCDLYVTLEPCPMCAGAIIQSRIRNTYFGAFDPKGGAVFSCVQLFDVSQFNHHPAAYGGILEEECAGLLKDFFREKRKKSKEAKRAFFSQKQNGENSGLTKNQK